MRDIRSRLIQLESVRVVREGSREYFTYGTNGEGDTEPCSRPEKPEGVIREQSPKYHQADYGRSLRRSIVVVFFFSSHIDGCGKRVHRN